MLENCLLWEEIHILELGSESDHRTSQKPLPTFVLVDQTLFHGSHASLPESKSPVEELDYTFNLILIHLHLMAACS